MDKESLRSAQYTIDVMRKLDWYINLQGDNKVEKLHEAVYYLDKDIKDEIIKFIDERVKAEIFELHCNLKLKVVGNG